MINTSILAYLVQTGNIDSLNQSLTVICPVSNYVPKHVRFRDLRTKRSKKLIDLIMELLVLRKTTNNHLFHISQPQDQNFSGHLHYNTTYFYSLMYFI